MIPKSLKTFFAILFVFVTAALISAQKSDLKIVTETQKITGEELKSLVKQTENKRPVLINFWATWCGPCRVEFPDLVKIDRDYRKKGLNFIVVSVDDFAVIDTRVPEFLRSYESTMPSYLINLRDRREIAKTVRQIAPTFRDVYPTTLLFDANGKLVFQKAGKVEAKTLRKEIDKVLPESRKLIVQDKPSNEERYKKWLEKDVLYIITKKEREDFLKLKTNKEKETFINNFWLRRDSTPETQENEFEQTHYERITFANENFASGIQGWRTDRGFVYITYGKPDKIERGFSDFEGLKNILFEKWSYKYLDEKGKNSEFIFLDPTESKEFRLEKEKREKLLKNIGIGLRICFNCSSL